ncbi:MAG: glycosyltransferase family 9 protein, partial [Myxococcales bacterium]|nr:glycosyltransferase family 9 protein [Myxococcales bacterium]
VLPHSFRSALVARLSGARWRVGYGRNGRSALLNHRVPSLTKERDVHGNWQIRPEPMVKHYLHITRAIGCLGANTSEELFYRPGIGEAVDRLLAERGIDRAKRLIGVNPGASFGSSKMWGAERFAALADRLAEDLGAEILLFGGPGEEPILDEIRGKMRAKAHFFGPQDATLATLKAFVDRLDLLVTNDTGPRHYAVAFDKPAVVIMGPTDPRYTDVNMELTEVLRRDVPCGPCHLRVCPIDHKCMTEIGPDEVFGKVQELLETAEFRLKKVLKRKKRA